MNRFAILSFLTLSLGLAACGDDHDHDHHDEDDHSEATVLDDACEHLSEGPNIEATAASDDATELPDVSAEHIRYDLTLNADGDTFAGLASYAAEEAGEFVLAYTGDATLMVFDLEGNEVELEAATAELGTCDLASNVAVVDFEIGTYTLSFDMASAAEIQLVVVHAEGHSHDE